MVAGLQNSKLKNYDKNVRATSKIDIFSNVFFNYLDYLKIYRKNLDGF